MKQGDRYQNSAKYTKENVLYFSTLSGDYNPIHINQEYASKTIFKAPIVHGMFVAAQISQAISQIQGAIYLSQTLNFRRPVYYDELIYCTVTVMEVHENKTKLRTICSNGENIVIEGEALIKICG